MQVGAQMQLVGGRDPVQYPRRREFAFIPVGLAADRFIWSHRCISLLKFRSGGPGLSGATMSGRPRGALHNDVFAHRDNGSVYTGEYPIPRPNIRCASAPRMLQTSAGITVRKIAASGLPATGRQMQVPSVSFFVSMTKARWLEAAFTSTSFQFWLSLAIFNSPSPHPWRSDN